MALFSASHSSVGKGSQKSGGTSGAHGEYVTRKTACSLVLTQNAPRAWPGRVSKFRAWLDKEEERDRKNARIIDKVMLALPRELSAVQRADLVRRFAQELTGGKTPWLAAFHDKGKDAHNPHCHFVLRDRHVETGKRVVQTTERGSTERIRELWERVANEALEAAGEAVRIDRRSLKAQRAETLDQARACLDGWTGRTSSNDDARAPLPGLDALDRADALLAQAETLDRKPQGHEGPEMRALVKKGVPSTKIDRIREARRASPKDDGKSEALDGAATAIAALVRNGREAHAAARAAEEARKRAERAREAREAAVRAQEAQRVREAQEAAQRAVLEVEAEARRVEAAAEARRAAEKAEAVRVAAEAARIAAEAQRAALEAKAASAAILERERAQEAQRAAQARVERHAQGRWRETSLLAAVEDRRDAAIALTATQDRRRRVAEMLDGTRDLATGALVPRTAKERLGTLPPRFGPRPSEAEVARQDYLDQYCDADGHEVVPYPMPSRQECADTGKDYETERAACRRKEQDRLERIATAKRRIWDEGLPERLATLAAAGTELEGSEAPGLARRALDAVRAVFDWMRQRIEAARGTLGATNPVTTELEGQWLDAVEDHAYLHDALRFDHEDQADTLRQEAGIVRGEEAQLWRQVEAKREAERAKQANLSYRPSGPSM